MEITKVCFRCGIEKPLSQFYKHKQMGDGHLNKCKECTKSDSHKRWDKNKDDTQFIEKEKKRCREKYNRLGYKEKQKEWDKNKIWKKSGIYKSLNKKLKNKGLLKDGEIVHHWNYNDEFLEDVFILPNDSIHKLIHSQIELNIKERIYYYKGMKLHTKKHHEVVINKILGINMIRQIKL